MFFLWTLRSKRNSVLDLVGLKSGVIYRRFPSFSPENCRKNVHVIEYVLFHCLRNVGVLNYKALMLWYGLGADIIRSMSQINSGIQNHDPKEENQKIN